PGGDLGDGQSLRAQLQHAPLGHIGDLLPAGERLLAVEGDLGDLLDQLGVRAVGADLQSGAGQLDVPPPGGEGADEHDLRGVGGDVGKPADPGGDVPPSGQVVHV